MLEGPILLGRLVFAMELARLREHTLNARRRGRVAKELACHLGKNWQAVLFIIFSLSLAVPLAVPPSLSPLPPPPSPGNAAAVLSAVAF